MTESGPWNRKGGTLSDVSAAKEYGIDAALITKGIRSGDLEYRDGSIWGNPYLRLRRDQLEAYIAKEHGNAYLTTVKAKAGLRAIRKERRDLERRLGEVKAREAALQDLLQDVG